MPDYVISIVRRAAIGEFIQIQEETPDAACKRAVEYGLSKQEFGPVEMFPWTCGVESLEDSNGHPLDVPSNFVDPAVRIEVLEQILRTLIDFAAQGPLPDLLVKKAKSLLGNRSTSV